MTLLDEIDSEHVDMVLDTANCRVKEVAHHATIRVQSHILSEYRFPLTRLGIYSGGLLLKLPGRVGEVLRTTSD